MKKYNDWKGPIPSYEQRVPAVRWTVVGPSLQCQPSTASWEIRPGLHFLLPTRTLVVEKRELLPGTVLGAQFTSSSRKV